MGEMRGDPGALPAVWGYWEYGVPCGYMSGDLLLTSQVPQGNLETMMRILINNSPGTPREETEEVAEVAMIRVNGR